MKLRNALFTVLVVALLTSCNRVKIRSDIAEFIASFSLEESVQSYLEGGYIQISITTTDEGVTKEVEEFTFNVKEANLPEYKKVISIYKDDVLESEEKEEIVHKDDKFYFVTKDGEEEYSLEDCHKKVETFFYKETAFDGTYHSRGNYRGDYIKQGIEYFQPYCTIDQEKELMTFDIKEENYDGNGKKYTIQSVYSVNKLGMLTEQNITGIKEGLTKTLNLTVYKK